MKAFLPLLDNLERALEYEKDNEGFRMIVKQMNDIFDKLGVKEIESDGKEFDPESAQCHYTRGRPRKR